MDKEETPKRLKVNDEEVGLRYLGNDLYEPNNLSIFEKVFHNEYVPNDEEFFTIRRFPKKEPKKYHKIESFCFVSTEELKQEAALLVKTLRAFHDQPIYIYCDDETRDFLCRLNLDSNDVFFSEEANPEILENLKENVFHLKSSASYLG